MILPWVKEMCEDVFGREHLEIGKRYKIKNHKDLQPYERQHQNGTVVEVTGGQFWGERGLSNFWYWREVGSDGKLKKKQFHGYDQGQFQLHDR